AQCATVLITSEAIGSRHTGCEADVMENCPNSHDFAVVVDSLHTTNRFSEQPRTHRVIEQIRFGKSLRMLNHGRDKRTIRYADACDQSSLRRVPIDERLRWRNRLPLV